MAVEMQLRFASEQTVSVVEECYFFAAQLECCILSELFAPSQTDEGISVAISKNQKLESVEIHEARKCADVFSVCLCFNILF